MIIVKVAIFSFFFSPFVWVGSYSFWFFQQFFVLDFHEDLSRWKEGKSILFKP